MKMRKYLLAAIAVALTVGSLSSCKQKLKQVDGVVTGVDITGDHHGDTVHTMRLYDGADTLLFAMKDAEYTNGLMIKGDSARIHYIKGHGDTLRALVVYVKPAPVKTIDLKTDTAKTLLTR